MSGVFSLAYGWRPPRREAARASLTVRGYFDFALERNGVIVDRWGGPNLIVSAGAAALAGLAIATGHTNAFDYLAIGIGATAPVAGNTALGSEITTFGGARALATLSRVTDTTTNDSSRLVKTFSFTAGASFAVTEAGVFDTAVSGGTMLCRQTFTAHNVTNGDNLTVTYTITFVPS